MVQINPNFFSLKWIMKNTLFETTCLFIVPNYHKPKMEHNFKCWICGLNWLKKLYNFEEGLFNNLLSAGTPKHI